MSGEFSKGGYIPGAPVTVKARIIGGRTEYFEPSTGAWVPVATAEEMKAYSAAAYSRIVTARDLLGADPDFTGGLSVDEYMDEQRGRGQE